MKYSECTIHADEGGGTIEVDCIPSDTRSAGCFIALRFGESSTDIECRGEGVKISSRVRGRPGAFISPAQAEALRDELTRALDEHAATREQGLAA